MCSQNCFPSGPVPSLETPRLCVNQTARTTKHNARLKHKLRGTAPLHHDFGHKKLVPVEAQHLLAYLELWFRGLAHSRVTVALLRSRSRRHRRCMLHSCRHLGRRNYPLPESSFPPSLWQKWTAIAPTNFHRRSATFKSGSFPIDLSSVPFPVALLKETAAGLSCAVSRYPLCDYPLLTEAACGLRLHPVC